MAPVDRNEFGAHLAYEVVPRLTSALAPDGHLVWISAKGSDVVCDPIKTKTLVAKSEIGRSFCGQLLAC